MLSFRGLTPPAVAVGLVACAAHPPAGQRVPATAQPSGLHHDAMVVVDPQAHTLAVHDRISVPPGHDGLVRFSLHAGLSPQVESGDARLTHCDDAPTPGTSTGTEDSADSPGAAAPLEQFAVELAEGANAFTLRYAGAIHHPIERVGEEYARSFSQTPGLIAENGVYLGGSTVWLPDFGGLPFTFNLDARVPVGWDVVSEGGRTVHEPGVAQTRVRWESTTPLDEAHLIAGQFHEWRRAAGDIELLAFLRADDPALAERYLSATHQYLQMYEGLIGPYPYRKFALVENSWETGFGMPSFTLLGPKVIRMPFILHSSYPHEILHNWWGNGVFVDYERGNWCEGLTAYLADHLFEEQRGQGAAYRRTALQRYSDYVAAARDFPLTEFRARHSSVTQAVGYDKMLMVFHLLRRQLGDRAFVAGLRKLYADHRFEAVSFNELAASFQTSDFDAGPFFEQWTERAGAPELRLQDVGVSKVAEGFELTVSLRQTQAGPPYRLEVPVAVTLEGGSEAQVRELVVSQSETTGRWRFAARPLRVDVDPEFDLFRRLDAKEVPPALSGAFGAGEALIVLPSEAPSELLAAYSALAEGWTESQSSAAEILLDSEVGALPSDRAVWLFGWENRYRGVVLDGAADFGASSDATGLRISGEALGRTQHSAVVAVRNPKDAKNVVAWVATNNPAAVPGLARKLPHYGKYSYLGFTGDEPLNTVKGIWPVTSSPLSVTLGGGDAAVRRGALGKRRALAELPAAFDEERMMADVRYLAAADKRGRGFGSQEAATVADWIARQMRTAGLRPAGSHPGSFMQPFASRGGEPERDAILRNVIGMLAGTDSELAGGPVVVGAHYDHLGLGWPDVRAEHAGQIHPGADDNASGVAVMLELARRLSTEPPPRRTVLFVAFDGEEAGLRGSRHFVSGRGKTPASAAIGMINLDTVGRLGDQPLLIFGTGTAREWVHIFRGAGYVTGVETRAIADDVGGSDQRSFIEAGVPAVQLFSGAHLDYHRPSDTAGQIDGGGLVKVAAVAREAVAYLAEQKEPLASTLGTGGKQAPSGHGAKDGGRRVSLGTVPDFTFEGPGVRLAGTTPGSPAEVAGMREGDVILKVGGHAVEDLRGLSAALKALEPGQTVEVVLIRAGETKTVRAVIAAR